MNTALVLAKYFTQLSGNFRPESGSNLTRLSQPVADVKLLLFPHWFPVYLLLAFSCSFTNPKRNNSISNTTQLGADAGSHTPLPQSAERLYIASCRHSESLLTARGDRLAGAAEANKGPVWPRPPLPPVTRRYLLRALF